MLTKLLATLPAILATTAFAQPIYFTANDLRTAPAAPVASGRPAAEYPAHLGQPIYFTANQIRTARPAAAVGAAADHPAQPSGPIYFIANALRTGTTQGLDAYAADAKVADAAALGARKHAPAN